MRGRRGGREVHHWRRMPVSTAVHRRCNGRIHGRVRRNICLKVRMIDGKHPGGTMRFAVEAAHDAVVV